MTPWYKNKLRRTLLDMHIEDWDDAFLASFDPDAYFAALKEARVTAAMIYAQSHVGLCYWPTNSGEMHRAFKGREDAIKRVFDACRAEDISTVLYYSIIYNNRAYQQHPAWRMIDAAGRGSMDFGGRYGLCCPNNAEYRNFVREQIAEFSDYFDFDGVFFDMTFWPEVCYCPSCKTRWREISRADMPRVIDWHDPVWRSFDRARHQWIAEFADFATAEAKKHKTGVTVEHQYGNSLAFWRYGNNENITKASDYIGTDMYGGVAEQSFACKAWYGLTQNQPFQYMTSRCYPHLGEHTTTKTLDQLRQCVAMTCLHHGAPLLIDAIDPTGTIDPSVYKLMGQVYTEAEKLEPWMTRGSLVWDVSLYFDLDGKYNSEANGYDVLDPAVRQSTPASTMPHYHALRSAAGVLARHQVPYGIVNSWKPEEMDNHRVLVLPDIPNMQPKQAEKVLEYLRKGGNIYLSGHASPLILKEVFGLTPDGLTEDSVTYMAPTKGSDVMRGHYSRQYPLIMFEHAAKVTGTPKGEVLATLTLPYSPAGIGGMFPTDVPEARYIDPLGPRARFSTIHSNPPGIATDMPAIVRATYGKGTAVYSALPIERADRFQHGEIFTGIIQELSDGDLSFGALCPAGVECILFDAPEYNQKLLGIIETRQENTLPLTHDIEVWVLSEAIPKSVTNHLGHTVPFKHNDNRVYLSLEAVDVYTLVVIEY